MCTRYTVTQDDQLKKTCSIQFVLWIQHQDSAASSHQRTLGNYLMYLWLVSYTHVLCRTFWPCDGNFSPWGASGRISIERSSHLCWCHHCRNLLIDSGWTCGLPHQLPPQPHWPSCITTAKSLEHLTFALVHSGALHMTLPQWYSPSAWGSTWAGFNGEDAIDGATLPFVDVTAIWLIHLQYCIFCSTKKQSCIMYNVTAVNGCRHGTSPSHLQWAWEGSMRTYPAPWVCNLLPSEMNWAIGKSLMPGYREQPPN